MLTLSALILWLGANVKFSQPEPVTNTTIPTRSGEVRVYGSRANYYLSDPNLYMSITLTQDSSDRSTCYTSLYTLDSSEGLNILTRNYDKWYKTMNDTLYSPASIAYETKNPLSIVEVDCGDTYSSITQYADVNKDFASLSAPIIVKDMSSAIELAKCENKNVSDSIKITARTLG